MLDSIKEVQKKPWILATKGKMIATSLGLFLFLLALFKDKDGFIFLIDHANLAFHEAGHVIFGVFGDTPGLYGGTLGQLVFPLVAVIAFWLRREAVSFAIAGVWFFENLLNISHYMADARAQILPLVGGGEHDWTSIFSRWGLLSHDTKLASSLTTLGCLGLIAMWIWLNWQWYKDRD